MRLSKGGQLCTDYPMDHVSAEIRSRIMSSVQARDTKPEMVVRRALHSAGLRFRLHDSRLPGRPDIVFSSRRIAVFVHGCFWHRCPKCRNGAKSVKSNQGYWVPKLERNADRDAENQIKLRRAGWKVRVIWECETRSPGSLMRLVDYVRRGAAAHLDRKSHSAAIKRRPSDAPRVRAER
jgi:DNA mismatch endonuclease (patch repair protein)